MSVLDIDKDFNMLSLPDLLTARDLYHLYLMAKQHVVGTAIGRYLIRKSDPWPGARRELLEHDTAQRQLQKKEPRTLGNSEVRPYSWPCVLVFIDRWVDESELSARGMLANDLVPRTLYLPDGSRVPVCVVYAPTNETSPPPPVPTNFPDHWVGGGFPLLIDSQGEEHVASVGCLVTDGHKTYALTNRHVTGAPGTPISTILGGEKTRVGVSADKQLTRKRFQEVYANWPGKNVYINLDIGLVEVEDVHQWTAKVYGIGRIGKVADLSADNISLRLIDCPVSARGAISGMLTGRIKGLFYRYKALAGFEYVADCLIGPHNDNVPLLTQPGDSGTLWLLQHPEDGEDPLPLAVQWGGQRFLTDGKSMVSPYVLATFLSTACSELEVDVIRDWNIGSLNYWGAVGHYAIGAKAIDFLAEPKLKTLMEANLDRISFAAEEITKKNTEGLSKNDFVQLADVPDLVWKIAKHDDGGRGQPEHPNHFADMDAKDSQKHTLLQICEADPQNLSVSRWQTYYDDVQDESRGLLPFRVWQFYQEMVDFVKAKDYTSFVCAAGILAHYVGDACQPLHISHLFDGDPEDTEQALVFDRSQHKKVLKEVPRARGVHSAYEKDMVNYHVIEIIAGIDKVIVPLTTHFKGGFAAAREVLALMQKTFKALPPGDIVKAYQKLRDDDTKPKASADALWEEFGDGTIEAMADGCRCLALIWESAWREGEGHKATGVPTKAMSPSKLSDLYEDQGFVQSFVLDKIGPILKGA